MRTSIVAMLLLTALLAPAASASAVCVAGACAAASAGEGAVCVAASVTTGSTHDAYRFCVPTGGTQAEALALPPDALLLP